MAQNYDFYNVQLQAMFRIKDDARRVSREHTYSYIVHRDAVTSRVASPLNLRSLVYPGEKMVKLTELQTKGFWSACGFQL